MFYRPKFSDTPPEHIRLSHSVELIQARSTLAIVALIVVSTASASAPRFIKSTQFSECEGFFSWFDHPHTIWY